MSNTDSAAVKQRLDALIQEEDPYQFGEVFRSAMVALLGSDALPEVSQVGKELDRSAGHNRERLEKMLADWVGGEVDDDVTLNHMMSFADHYRYGAITEGADFEEMKSQWSSKDQESFPFAQQVINAWFNVAEHAPSAVGERHLMNWRAVAESRSDAKLAEFFGPDWKERMKEGSNRCLQER